MNLQNARSAEKIVAALRCCGNTDTKKPDCEHCPLQSTRMCVKVMLEGAADLIVRLNDFDQSQSKIALERCQKAEAQLGISQRETQAAVEDILDAALTPCTYCKGNPINGGTCDMCNDHHDMFACWQWRGPDAGKGAAE